MATAGRLGLRTRLAGPPSLLPSASRAPLPLRYRPLHTQTTAPRQLLAPALGQSYIARPSPSLFIASPSLLHLSRSLSTTPLRSYAQPAPASPNTPGTSSPKSPTIPSSSSTTDPEGDPEPDVEPDPPNASAYQRFRTLTRRYGWYALGMYIFLSSIDFSLCLLTVHAVGADRIEPAFDAATHQVRVWRYGADEAATREAEDRRVKAQAAAELAKEGKTDKEGKKSSSSGLLSKTFWAEAVLAYAIHKTLLLPFRAGLTVAWTPKVVGWLASRGWVGKGGMTRAATHAQGKIRDAQGRIRDASDRVRDAAKRKKAD